MKTFLSFVAILALTVSVSAQGNSGGGNGGNGNGGNGGGGNNGNGNGGGGNGYGGCPPAASPAPAPAPAPAPGPGPGPAPSPGAGPAPGGGSTPGGAPSGGSTPGGAGGSTPGARGGATPGGRGFGGRGGGFRGGKKTRFSSEQQFWLGAVTLPWEGTFLPRGGGDGYDGREMTIEQAVASRGKAAGWKMKRLPTIVLVYDPSNKNHMKSLGKVSSDKTFVSASRYFNLFRVDVRTIQDKKVRRRLKEATFIMFQADGTKVASVKKPMSVKPMTKSLDKVFVADFGKSLKTAAASMGAVLARKAWVEDEIRRHETVLFDPITGKLQQNIRAAIANYKKELKDLAVHEAILTRLQAGSIVSN